MDNQASGAKLSPPSPGAEQLQLDHPVWQTVPAVQSKRASQVDFMTWMNRGVIANRKKVDDVLKV